MKIFIYRPRTSSFSLLAKPCFESMNFVLLYPPTLAELGNFVFFRLESDGDGERENSAVTYLNRNIQETVHSRCLLPSVRSHLLRATSNSKERWTPAKISWTWKTTSPRPASKSACCSRTMNTTIARGKLAKPITSIIPYCSENFSTFHRSRQAHQSAPGCVSCPYTRMFSEPSISFYTV